MTKPTKRSQADVPDTVEALLQQMVRLNTVNTAASDDPLAEAKLCDYLDSVAQAMGLATRRLPVADRGENLLVTCETSPERPWLLFVSHMDTVTIEGMTIDALGARIEDGKLWGRGSCDTKGTGAAMLWALRQYAGETHRPTNVAIVFSVDEEYGMSGVRSFVRRDYPSIGFRAAGVIVGEPTMLKPITAHNGVGRLKVITHGIAAHSSKPAAGRSAISRMMRVVDAIESRYIPSLTASHPMTGKAQASINIIRGGSQINIIPDRCEIHCDRRLVPGEAPESVAPAIEALVDELRQRDKGLEAEVEMIFDSPPLCPESAEPILPTVQRALGSCGLPAEPVGAGYATEAADLALGGIPGIVLGPGDAAKAHTKDEFLEIDQLHKGVEVYLALLRADWT